MFSCKFCSKTFVRPSSIVLHEKACKENPNRIAGKNQWSNDDWVMSETTREKIRAAGTGRITSEETKTKLSEIRVQYLRDNPDKVPYKLNHYTNGESYPEKYWRLFLESNNIAFQAEFQVASYRLDFAIGMIDLEIDGEQHYVDERILRSDKRRTEYLENIGWKVIRIRWSGYQKKSVEAKQEFCTELLKILLPSTINQ